MKEHNKEQFYRLLGIALTKARKESKLSQEAVANKIDMSRASIVNIEKGRQHPPVHVLWTLAELYETTIETLVSKYKKPQSEVTNKKTADALNKETKKTPLTEEALSLLRTFVSSSDK